MKFCGTDVRIIHEAGLVPLASGGPLIRESSWPFPSSMHFGRKMRWWLVYEELDGYEDGLETFCELWHHARDFREVDQC